jgi:excisionase family DNA binding protein
VTAPTAQLTVLDVATELRVDKQTVYRLIWGGELGWTDISTRGAKRARIRISAHALQAYLKKRERRA